MSEVAERVWQPGGLTFVFTDIEGSTSLVRDLQSTYGLALRIHRRLVRACFEAEGGSEFGTEGDGLFYVFSAPGAAVAGAVAAQQKVESYDWPDGIALRVRIGLHRGPVTISGGEYVGITVHEVARICAAAHGGQILCSGTVLHGLSESPNGVEFRSLGAYTMRGLPEPYELFQICAAGTDADFPPPRDALRDGGARLAIWRRARQATEHPTGDALLFCGVDGAALDPDLRVERLPASGTSPDAFRLIVYRAGVVEEEFDGLTIGGATDAATILGTHSQLIRVRAEGRGP